MKKAELKRGKFSEQEMEFMVQNSHLPEREVASKINRSPETVLNFWKSKGLYIPKTTANKQEENRLLTWLHSLPYWPSIIAGFNNDEIKYYEQNWISFIKQFNEDVSNSEHLYIKDWIILEIEKMRVLSREKDAIQRIDELKSKIRELENKHEVIDEFTTMLITNMASELATREGVIAQSISSLNNLNKDIKTISDKLKADRVNRRDKETSATTYWLYIDKIQDDELFRNAEIAKAEMLKASMEKSTKDLYNLHPFEDKTLDRCILNSTSVLLDDNNE